MNNNRQDAIDSAGVGRRRKKSQETGQALKFKAILEQPIGRLWFPSLGNVGPDAPSASAIPVTNSKAQTSKVGLKG